MSIVGTIGNRVEITLGITIAGKAISELSTYGSTWTLLKGFIALSGILSLVSSPSSVESSSTFGSAIRMLRRICVIVVAQLLMSNLQIQPSLSSEQDVLVKKRALLTDLQLFYTSSTARSNISVFSWIPLSILPTIESFILSSLAIVAVAFVARVTSTFQSGAKRDDDNSNNHIPELDRIIFSIQFLYADTVSNVIIDDRIRAIVAFAGVVFITPIAHAVALGSGTTPSTGTVSSYRMLMTGITMAWVNILVQIIIPNRIWSASTGIDLATALTMALIIQAMKTSIPGLESIQGYVEWHISTVAISMATTTGASWMGNGNGYLVAVAVAFIGKETFRAISSIISSSRTGGKVSATETIENVGTIIMVNSAAAWLLNFVMNRSVFDGATIVIVAVVLARGFTKIFNTLQFINS